MLPKEIGYALRQLRKTPGFTLVAILTLALGIGGSTAVFTVVDSVILKPLSYRNSGQLVVLWERVKFLGSSYTGPNARHALMWQDRAGAFSGLALLSQGANGVALGAAEHPRLIGTVRAAPNLLDVLEVTPLIGRNFRPQDAVKGHDNVAILTHSLWQSLFHGDTNVIGKTVRVANLPREVIGVLPESFRFPKRSVLSAGLQPRSQGEVQEVEMLLPAVIDPSQSFGWNSDYGNWLLVGRLKPGITIKQAEAELNTIQEQIIREMPPDQRPNDTRNALRAYVQPMQEAVVGDSQKGLWLLLASVAGLMLIACVNLANAQLGRTIAREREAAVRSALGANQWQLLWSSLAENLLLAAAGGVTGVWLASAAVSAFRRYPPIDLPRMAEIHLNWSVLFFTAVLIIGSGCLFGLLPALKSVRADPQRALQNNSNRAQGTRQSRSVRSFLIGFQVFACTALLLVSGLFAKSLLHLLGSDKGFDTVQVMAAEVNLSRSGSYSKDQSRIAFDDAVLNQLRTLPGVQSAALVSAMPLEGETWINGIFRTDRPTHNPPLSNWRWVSPGYFEIIHERLVSGRLFEDRDRNAKTVIISEASAKAAWPGENPIGRQIHWQKSDYTVIGIVRDARNNSLKLPPANMVYFLYTELPSYSTVFLVRSAQSPNTLAAVIRKAIWDYDSTVTIARIKSLDSQLTDSLASERFHTFILVAFGTAALFLATLGIYGVLSYTVATRKQEIGVRMALGATRQRIYALTMSEATIPVLTGLLGGWAASIAVGRIVRTLLYGVKETDVSVTIIVATLFLLAATVAAFLPAHRAATVDPMEALRTE